MEELYKMKTMATRVFIVHMSGQMGARLFLRAKDAGMMSEGYSWILTDGLSNIVDSFSPFTIDAMQGALGVRLRMPKSWELKDFNVRWKRRYRQDHPSDEPPELSIYGLLAYDTTWSLAMSIEEVRAANSSFNTTIGLGTLPISNIGPKILQAILANNFTGVSGEFHLIDGQSQSSTFEIINVVGRGGRVIGYWTPTFGLSKELDSNSSRAHTGSNLNPIIWPGESFSVPKGWEIPTAGTKLKIGTPVKRGYPEFVDVRTDNITNVTTVHGYNIDVFEAAIQKLKFVLSYEYIPFMNATGEMAGTYNDLIYEVYRQNYDAVVGDTTIRANRTKYVDFTLPYNELGVSMIVPVKGSRKDAWLFTKPLSLVLWIGILFLFFLTGFVVWANERRINHELSLSEQFAIFFFLPTLIFDNNALKCFPSKVVMVVWVFVLLILTQSYTANLASLLTVEQLEPAIKSLHDLKKNGLFIGYFNGSFIENLLLQLGFDKSKLRSYNYPDEFAEALTKGSKGGGVSAIVHEIPYIKSFLAKYCEGFTMVGPVYQSEGFGFAFPKGSPLVPEISRALLEVLEGDEIKVIEKKWFGNTDDCVNKQSKTATSVLYPSSFLGLFLILGGVLLASFFYTLIMFLLERWGLLEPDYLEALFGAIKTWFGIAEIDTAGVSLLSSTSYGRAEAHGNGNHGLGADIDSAGSPLHGDGAQANARFEAHSDQAIEMVVLERAEGQGANQTNEAQRRNEEAQKRNEGGPDQEAEQLMDRRIPGHPHPNMRNRRWNGMRSQSMPVNHSADDEIALLYP